MAQLAAKATMLILVIGRKSKACAWLIGAKILKGFTLIEVLVVLTIMSIMLGLVTANFAMDERQSLQQEAHKLALLMRHASDTARTTGKPIAWQATKQGYIFCN